MKFISILTLLLVCSTLARRTRLSLARGKITPPLTQTQIKEYRAEFISESVKLLDKLSKDTKTGIQEQYRTQAYGRTRHLHNFENFFLKIISEIDYPFRMLKKLLQKEEKYASDALIPVFSEFVYCISKMSKITENTDKLLHGNPFDWGRIYKISQGTKLAHQVRETQEICSHYETQKAEHYHNYFDNEHEQLEIIRIRFNSYILLNDSNLGLSDVSEKGDFNKIINTEHACLKSNWG